MLCIICKTNEVNPQIGKSFCSRICESIYFQYDLEFLTEEQIKRIALARLNQLVSSN